MSSLRLALKQSLQETGVGTFSSGHGEKKKRKKKKNIGSISAGSGGNGNSFGTKKGRRDEDSGGKRKRGRPRKHPRSQDHDENNLIGGDDQPRRADRRRDRPRTSRHDVGEEDEDDEFYSENEFSCTEEDSDDDSDDDDDSVDDDDGSPYRSRSRARNDYLEDEEGEEDETMHSDEDNFRPQPTERQTESNDSEKDKATATSCNEIDRKDKPGEISQQQDKKNASDAQKATNSSDGPSSESKGAASVPSEPVIPSNVPVNVVSGDDEMMRKKLKLQKLKKKLEKSQNFAAHKIQKQWKKKVKTSSQSEQSNGEASPETAITSSITIKTSSVAKEKISDTKEDAKSMSPNLSAGAGASSKPSATNIGAQQKLPQNLNQSTSADGVAYKSETSSSNSGSHSVAATNTTPSISSAVAGDRGSTIDTDNGKEQPPPAKKNKKKNKNNNGIVPAPTRELREWSAKMLIKKARRNIQVGMRVKVRFATQVKRDGKLVQKKHYYGGRVAGRSKKRSKIKIIYDDGTSEWSKFPDRDVVVDAVDNGEHSVPADKFIPPSEEQPAETDVDEKKYLEEGEEGEIPNPSKAVTVTETEEGEVEEDTESKVRASHPKSSDPSDIRTISELKEPADEAKASAKTEIAVKMPPAFPSTPPSGMSSMTLPNKEKTSVVGSSSNTHGNDDVKKECVTSPSQEEGELSPGITKVSENVSEQQRHQITELATESKPLPLMALLPSKVGSEKPTTEPIKFAADNPPSKTSKVEAVMQGQENNNVKIVKEIPLKKKLSIRIPSNSLATIKSFSSPKSAGSAKSPMVEPSTSNVGGIIHDILTDTPEAKKEIITKRKRVAGDGLLSVDISSGHVSHAKKRIKVAIGKNLLENNSSKTMLNDASTKFPKNVTGEGLLEEDLASIPEEPISTGETKKKKKKADCVRSPRTKSPLLNPESDKIKNNNNSTQTPSTPSTPKQQKIGSKGSAFSEKKSIVKEEGPKQTSLKASSSKELIGGVSSALRTGRKAAEEAKEKMSVKQKAKLNVKEPKEKELAPPESSKKKKKRRREKETEEHGEESDIEHNETEWVQCDNCKKWRVLPDNIKASSLPDLWYCHMNVYDPKRSKCEAPEQKMKDILRERKKRARKRAKREAELAEFQQEKSLKKSKQQEEETTATTATMTTKKKIKQEKQAGGGSTPRSVSPKPSKSAKASGVKSKESIAEAKKATAEAKKATAEAKRANIEGNKKPKSAVEEQPNPTDSGSDTQKEVKKKSKKGKKELQDNSDNQDLDADCKKSGRKRGRPSNRKEISGNTAPTSSVNDNEDEDNVEWVQCDKCEKWRKLPPDISADELPGSWDCSMNTWNPASASCQAAEDKTDAHHQEVGASEWQLRQTHAGKYSYRQMIFGTGARKHNRPMSERARAAESLFIQTNTDEENSHPTTQYTKSSAFLPRVSNFQKNLAIEENSLGIFDVLRHSNMWEDLRTMDMNPSKVLSTSAGYMNIPGQKLKTYECLSDEIKHAMQDVVLQTLGFGCLTGEEVVGKAQWFPYETSIKGVAGIRGYCNEDIIIHTLLDLVRDGMVEMATVRNPFCSMTQWVPRYRRVGTRRAIEAVEAIKASRCMKISKPWKQRPTESTTTTEWVTGQKVN